MPKRIALGTALYGSQIEESTAFELLDTFYESGGRRLDTAHVYASWLKGGEGASERCLGRWIKQRGLRDEMFVITKGAHPPLEGSEKRVNAAAIDQDLSESLERLQSDFIDLYFLHRDDADIPIGEIAEWMHERQARGDFRGYGVSNWDLPRIDALLDYCKKNGLHAPVANQIGFSLARTTTKAGNAMDMRFMDVASFDWHAHHPLTVYAYSSQAKGLFAKCGSFDELLAAPGLEDYQAPENRAVLADLLSAADELGVKPLQAALAFFLYLPFECSPIIGARTLAQLKESMAASKIQLSEAQNERLIRHWR